MSAYKWSPPTNAVFIAGYRSCEPSKSGPYLVPGLGIHDDSSDHPSAVTWDFERGRATCILVYRDWTARKTADSQSVGRLTRTSKESLITAVIASWIMIFFLRTSLGLNRLTNSDRMIFCSMSDKLYNLSDTAKEKTEKRKKILPLSEALPSASRKGVKVRHHLSSPMAVH